MIGNVSCDSCTLQWSWFTPYGVIRQCSDIMIYAPTGKQDKAFFHSYLTLVVKECLGLCKNGGVCYDGACLCREQYEGEHCEIKLPTAEEVQNEKKIKLLFLVALFIVLCLCCCFCVSFFLAKKGAAPALVTPTDEKESPEKSRQKLDGSRIEPDAPYPVSSKINSPARGLAKDQKGAPYPVTSQMFSPQEVREIESPPPYPLAQSKLFHSLPLQESPPPYPLAPASPQGQSKLFHSLVQRESPPPYPITPASPQAIRNSRNSSPNERPSDQQWYSQANSPNRSPNR